MDFARPPLPHYVPAPETHEKLDWANLAVVDISKSNTPEGLAELTPLVRDALHGYGFMYVINHGLSKEQNERIFDIADVPFSAVSAEEKVQYESITRQTGVYRGYKLPKYLYIDNGVRDSFEHYNIHHPVDDRWQTHPVSLRPFLPEIRAFNEYNHYNILLPILRMLALGLELPEETFVDIHPFDGNAASSWLRCSKYHPYSEDDAKKANDVWFVGHTDATSMSILWSQPVAALQVMSPDGKWRWVKHMENALVVNVGECMEMLSGGFYKAAIHRVVQPPGDQRGLSRLGVFYFANTDDDVPLVPYTRSPVLQRTGIVRKCADEDAPTMGEWMRARFRAYRKDELPKDEEGLIGGGVNEEILRGISVTHYD